MPAAVAEILEILTSGTSEYTALPELIQRVALLEKKIDYLQKSLSPERPMMDTQAVCRVLKLRPKAVSELAASGVLPTRTEGRRTLFYEDAVVKYFMTQPTWNSPAPAKRAYRKRSEATRQETDTAPEPVSIPEDDRRIGAAEAARMLGRSSGAIYQLIFNNRIPFHRDGTTIFFQTAELREWAMKNPARPRKNLRRKKDAQE